NTDAQEHEKSGDRYQIAYVPPSGPVRVTYYDDPDIPSFHTEELDVKVAGFLAGENARPSDSLQIWNYTTAGVGRNVLLAYHGLIEFPAHIIVYGRRGASFTAVKLWATFTAFCGIVMIGLLCIMAYRNVHRNIVLPVVLLNEGA